VNSPPHDPAEGQAQVAGRNRAGRAADVGEDEDLIHRVVLIAGALCDSSKAYSVVGVTAAETAGTVKPGAANTVYPRMI